MARLECDSLATYLDLNVFYCSIKGLNKKKNNMMNRTGIKVNGMKKQQQEEDCINISPPTKLKCE